MPKKFKRINLKDGKEIFENLPDLMSGFDVLCHGRMPKELEEILLCQICQERMDRDNLT
jgi:hypothetical protein